MLDRLTQLGMQVVLTKLPNWGDPVARTQLASREGFTRRKLILRNSDCGLGFQRFGLKREQLSDLLRSPEDDSPRYFPWYLSLSLSRVIL